MGNDPIMQISGKLGLGQGGQGLSQMVKFFHFPAGLRAGFQMDLDPFFLCR
jgi:hypothetical protein